MYLRADGEEIDMGPYQSLEEAKKAMENYSVFGAPTSGPIKVKNDYKLFKGA